MDLADFFRNRGRTRLMGVLNVTPDSFSDGGKHFDTEAAREAAHRLAAEGADVVDVGGESTRPGHTPVRPEEEIARITPVLMAVCPSCSVPVSIDTSKAIVAEEALRLGARIVNDIWGLQRDPRMARVIADAEAGVVLMHNAAAPLPDRPTQRVREFLEKSIRIALKTGIRESRIAIDPGIGFGKTAEQNWQLLRDLPKLAKLGFPVLVGASRKSFLGPVTDTEDPGERLPATLAVSALAVERGARILRVHDIAGNLQAIRVADKLHRPQDRP